LLPQRYGIMYLEATIFKEIHFMKKILLLAIILTVLVCGCTNKGSHNNVVQPPEPPQKENMDPLQKQIEMMSIDEKIGQLVMVGLDGYEIDEAALDMIHKYKVGGFVLFKRNVQSAQQVIALINSLKEANRASHVPLFIAVDEEGGRVSRMPDEFLKLPASRSIGKVNSEEFAFEVGSVIGEAIRALGFNMNFAPVLDIDSNPKNPVIGDRSFGQDPEIVSSLGGAFMKGLQSHLISTIKHFPGHGDTSVDSHVGLPVINHPIDRLKSFELVPFAKAIESGADAVMIAHILLPEIDELNPASFSKAVISDILREEMKFDGLVITDDMTMGAIVENFDIGEAAVKSLQAGADIILVCHDHQKQIKVLEALKQAAADGALDEGLLDQHVYRVLRLKQKYDLRDEAIEGVDVEAINEKIRGLLDKYYN